MEGEYKHIHKVKLQDISSDDETSYKVHCPSCEATVPAENMNIVDKIAKCDSCDSLFPLDVQKFKSESSTKKEVVERPSSVSIRHEGILKEIEVRDKKGIKGFLAFIYLLASFFLFMLFMEGPNEFFITLNVLAWSFTLWYTYIYRSLTQTAFIEMDGHYLTMEYVPWFFTRKKEIEISTMKDVYVYKDSSPWSGRKGHQVLISIDKGDGIEEIKLMPWTYQSLQEAAYIKQEIESYLALQ